MMQDLHDRDFNLWLEEQAIALKNKDTETLDWANLLEEIEDMGRSDKRALRSNLGRLLEHLLKLRYWETEKERCANGWKIEIRAFRKKIRELLEESPSLKNYLASIFEKELVDAKETVSGYFLLPEDAIIILEQALNREYFG